MRLFKRHETGDGFMHTGIPGIKEALEGAAA